MRTKEAVNAALKIVGAAGLDTTVVAAPNALQGFGILLKKSPVPKADYEKVLNELRRQELVIISRDEDGMSYGLTPAGAHRLQQVIIDELEVKVPAKWDKKWRLVTFDIPVRHSKQRAAFTHRLQSMGFMMLQKSIWVHPAPCFETIEQLAGHYNLLRYCSFAELSKVDDLSARRLKRHFTL
ncbi:MAG TPA: hypothetical protein VMT23_03185 [Candidatus Binatia bacterium]|nr:hypothetical protein [Candidatus Binatia bacterium]